MVASGASASVATGSGAASGSASVTGRYAAAPDATWAAKPSRHIRRIFTRWLTASSHSQTCRMNQTDAANAPRPACASTSARSNSGRRAAS